MAAAPMLALFSGNAMAKRQLMAKENGGGENVARRRQSLEMRLEMKARHQLARRKYLYQRIAWLAAAGISNRKKIKRKSACTPAIAKSRAKAQLMAIMHSAHQRRANGVNALE